MFNEFYEGDNANSQTVDAVFVANLTDVTICYVGRYNSTPADSGMGYLVGDVIVLNDEGDGAAFGPLRNTILQVTSTGAGGAVTGVNVLCHNLYTDPSAMISVTVVINQLSTTGSGTGLAYDLEFFDTPIPYYSWVEQTFNPEGIIDAATPAVYGQYNDAISARQGDVTSQPAFEINNRIVDIDNGAFVWMRLKGAVSGQQIFEFQCFSESGGVYTVQLLEDIACSPNFQGLDSFPEIDELPFGTCEVQILVNGALVPSDPSVLLIVYNPYNFALKASSYNTCYFDTKSGVWFFTGQSNNTFVGQAVTDITAADQFGNLGTGTADFLGLDVGTLTLVNFFEGDASDITVYNCTTNFYPAGEQILLILDPTSGAFFAISSASVQNKTCLDASTDGLPFSIDVTFSGFTSCCSVINDTFTLLVSGPCQWSGSMPDFCGLSSVETQLLIDVVSGVYIFTFTILTSGGGPDNATYQFTTADPIAMSSGTVFNFDLIDFNGVTCNWEDTSLTLTASPDAQVFVGSVLGWDGWTYAAAGVVNRLLDSGDGTISLGGITDVSGVFGNVTIGTIGFTGTVDLAPLTTLGSPGTLTVVDGLIQAYSAPT